MKQTLLLSAFLGAAVLAARQPAPQTQTPPPASQTQQPPQPPQPGEINTTITGGGTGIPPRFAVPDFIAITPDAETVAVAKTIAQVLFDDLAFEREFLLIPRDVYSTIPAAHSINDVPLDRWRELNADGVIVGSVQKTANGVHVEARLFNVATRQAVFNRQYDGSAANPRLYAHTISDEVHQQQRGLNGVARSKLTFDSDRDGERLGHTIEARSVKEVYISDYDGVNQRRVTIDRTLNITPRWSPDGRSIAYTSYRRGPGNIFISNIFQGTLEELTKGPSENWLPAWSPDGARIAFCSPRSGNPEIYVVNRDGSNLRKLTDNPSIDTSPTWSPSGTQIAFVSDRTGSPQIYVIGADGLGLRKITSESYADKPTWSPLNEIAFAAKTGPGFDVKVLNVTTGDVTQITFGEGTNESPVFAPNGRHLAFMSTRKGKEQIFTVARDGKDIRQLTTAGNNEKPDWSR